MVRRVLAVLSAFAIVVFAAVPAFAQGGATSSSISGTVVDASGGAIPGASIEAKNAANGTLLTAVSGSNGSFNIPAVPSGTYSISVTLQGFKTAVFNGVVVSAVSPATISAKLEVGGVSETVIVEGAGAIVQTQATSVTATLNVAQIQALPLTSRNVIDFLTFLPGVNVASSNRSANVNGLPGSAVNITLDGVNIQDNTLKTSDGFFTIVQPRTDAIEEVSITGAAAGAADGQGAITVKFVTRAGTNSYNGSFYEYVRRDEWNKNTWFNLRDGVAKVPLRQYQTGGRLGGPIWLPGIFSGQNKAFFFSNIEKFHQPSGVTRARTILRPTAQAGVFSYTTATGTSNVNLISLAAANGQLATMDPTIVALLNDIRTATGTTGTITDSTDPLYQTYNYNSAQKSDNWFPTVRVDFNFGKNHKFSSVYNHDVFNTSPDATTNSFEPTFPGFPNFGSQTSKRISVSNTLRSTFGSNIVNEARFAVQGSPVLFFPEQESTSLWNGPLANQKGFQLNISAAGITNAGPAPNAQSRNAIVYTYEDTVSLSKGSHSISAGISVTKISGWGNNITAVPTIAFGLQTNDPATAMFSTANFPGASTANLNAARALYSVLTGRVSSITGNARIDAATGQYVYQGAARQQFGMTESGIFVQDAWRLRPNLTINYGLRYELQGAFSASNSLYSFATPTEAFGLSGLTSTCDPDEPTAAICNLFKPGTLPGTTPKFQQLTSGAKAYGNDTNNIAPSIGVNWTPTSENGFLKAVMGDSGQFVLRGGWTRAYTRNGLSDYSGVFNANPGIRIAVNKNEGLGNLGSNLVLLRNDSQLTPAAFPTSPTYPLSGVVTDSINVFASNLRQPYADSYTFGVQRGLTKNMAIEVRYVGTRSRDALTTYNLNGEVNINENGFLNEFKNAQKNLQLAVAAGKAASFKYDATVAGSVPLPIYQAYFSGVSAANAGNAALYTSANYTNATFVNRLAKYNPNPFSAAADLAGSGAAAAQRSNALAAGLPSNFFYANPDYLGGASITGNGGFTRFNGIQTEIRRRLANGIQFQANYSYGKGYQSTRYSFRVARKEVSQTGGGGDVTHALKGNIVFDLPFGKGRHFFGSANPILDAIVGGWQVNMNTRFQSGRLLDLGNVRMVGFTESDLQGMYKLRHDSTSGVDRIYMLPDALIQESIKAFSVSATSATGYGSLGAPSGQYFAPANGPDCIESIAAGYGDCGTRTLVVRGPKLMESDLAVVKSLTVFRQARVEIRLELLNVFNNLNFVPVGGVGGTVQTSYEVTGLTGINASRQAQVSGRVTWGK